MGINDITMLPPAETRPAAADGKHDLRFLIPLTGFLIVLVVLVHAGCRYFDTTYVGQNVTCFSLLDRLLETFISFPVTVFVFVSAFRFEYGLRRNHKYLDANDHFLFTRFARKRFVRLYVPYILWSAIYFLLISIISIVWRQYVNDSPPFSSIEGDRGLFGWINGLGNPS
jgi:peptidoglycan/LPS O-acetylase OafA/YrhL